MAGSIGAEQYDVVFFDTCICGSSVASNFTRPDAGQRAMFVADYAVNPLGVKSDTEVRTALHRWVSLAAGRSDVMTIACNTASVRLEDSLGVRREAEEHGLHVWSMVDLLDVLLAREAENLAGRRVCVLGTEYTVGRSVYAHRLRAAGVHDIVPLGATLTERAIARLQYESREAREAIRAEVSAALGEADAVLLACTCFPLVSDLIEEIRPGILQLDPGREIRSVTSPTDRGEPNRLTLAVSGEAISGQEIEARARQLFPGWDEIEVIRLAD